MAGGDGDLELYKVEASDLLGDRMFDLQARIDFQKIKIEMGIHEKFDGGPVGVNTIAAALGEERDTIEELYEPYLMQIGFLDRTSRGRRITARALTHLKASRKAGQGRLWD